MCNSSKLLTNANAFPRSDAELHRVMQSSGQIQEQQQQYDDYGIQCNYNANSILIIGVTLVKFPELRELAAFMATGCFLRMSRILKNLDYLTDIE